MSAFLSELSVTPLADGQQWRVNTEFRYRSNVLLSGRGDNLVTVPAGFITDMASIPALFRGVLPVWNRYGPSAVVHDHGYWSQDHSREDVDRMLLEGMTLLGVPQAQVVAIFNAVRVFGESAWKNAASLKANGYKRMASMKSLPPYAAVA